MGPREAMKVERNKLEGAKNSKDQEGGKSRAEKRESLASC
jgi:hypothetical protein